MAPSPWLSVVMPAFNGERYIHAALESVRREGGEGVEVVIVFDEGCTDRTLEIARSFAGALAIRLVPSPRGRTWIAATNLGLAEARARHACFLHQDDTWLPGRLAAVRAELEREPDAALVLHAARYVGPEGEPLGTWRCPLPEGRVEPELLVERLLVQNFIAICSPVFLRERALRSGGLDPSLWYAADWDLWLRLAAEGPARYLRRPLAAFRLHPGSLTLAQPAAAQEMRTQLRTVLERHLSRWPEARPRRREVVRVAAVSAAVNGALADAVRGHRVAWWPPVRDLLRLGPSGWRRFLRDTRLVERVGARLRMRVLLRRSRGA